MYARNTQKERKRKRGVREYIERLESFNIEEGKIVQVLWKIWQLLKELK